MWRAAWSGTERTHEDAPARCANTAGGMGTRVLGVPMVSKPVGGSSRPLRPPWKPLPPRPVHALAARVLTVRLAPAQDGSGSG
jgi:hypothetical protein